MSRAGTGRGTVRRSDRGGWEGWISLPAQLGSGKSTPRKHVRGRTQGEVLEKLDAIRIEVRAGVIVPVGSDTTVSDWLSTWVAAKTSSVRPSTLSGYRTDQLLIDRSIGAVKLRALTPELVEAMYSAVLNGLTTGGGSVAYVRRTLSAALTAAVDRRYIATNPCRLAIMPSHAPAEVEPYTLAETRCILAVAKQGRSGARWTAAFALGLRQGEALGLHWSDVDLDAGELRVRTAPSWLPWRHGCAAAGQEPTCGQRNGSRCPKRHSIMCSPSRRCSLTPETMRAATSDRRNAPANPISSTRESRRADSASGHPSCGIAPRRVRMSSSSSGWLRLGWRERSDRMPFRTSRTIRWRPGAVRPVPECIELIDEVHLDSVDGL